MTAIALCALLLAGLADERVVIPAGTAVVGADAAEVARQLEGSDARPDWYADESPKRTVAVPSFAIDRTEVTNARYRTVVTGHAFPQNLSDHPVVMVTFAEAKAFCEAAGGRLPREEEWERAARGEKGNVYPWGNGFDPRLAVHAGSAGGEPQLKVGAYALEESSAQALGGTRAVGSNPAGASPFGVLDMAGNAWEWVDGFHDEMKGMRLLKGGSWLAPAASLRASVRLGDPGQKRYNDFGFRCAYGAP
ncbi:MAG: SUMF1/EgtB/PvdO family nonheme iron enzyme [Nitrospinae bacterium]|nr:SUMF1/EgtB/PvdO family nonheme iron enzyme [Nitrospinota bacterium]